MRFLAIFLITIFSTASVQAGEANVEITCTYINFNHFYFGSRYTCTLNSNPDVTQPEVNITAVSNPNDCRAGRTIDDVEFFDAVGKIIRYLPRGIEKVFKKLIGLRFENTQLRYISKEDLKPYAKIRYFISYLNQIEFLEKDLFTYTTELQVVSFRSNQIKYIDPDVFEGLRSKLVNLWLDGTVTVCGLRAALTSNDCKTQLDNLRRSQCVNIDNAPAFYIFQLNLKPCECTTTTSITTTTTTAIPTTTTSTTTDSPISTTTTTDSTSTTVAPPNCDAEVAAAEARCDATLASSVKDCTEALQCCTGSAPPTVLCAAPRIQNYIAAYSR